MTNSNDSAFPHDGIKLAVQKDIASEFPHVTEEIASIPVRYDGLTKREYFAAMAISHVVQQINLVDDYKLNCVLVAKSCVNLADALIKELSK